MDDDLGQMPWDRRKGEPRRAYEAFCRYIDSSERAPVHFARAEEMKPGEVVDWHARYEWEDRATAWDAERDRLVDVRRRQAIDAAAHEWARREWEMVGTSIDILGKIDARILDLLSWPMEEMVKKTVREDGHTTIIHVHPAKWTTADIAKLMDARRTVFRDVEFKMAGSALPGDADAPADGVWCDSSIVAGMEAASKEQLRHLRQIEDARRPADVPPFDPGVPPWTVPEAADEVPADDPPAGHRNGHANGKPHRNGDGGGGTTH